MLKAPFKALEQLTNAQLEQLYAGARRPTTIPVGAYTGRAWSHDIRMIGWLSRVWAGKVFRGDRVVNRLAGREAIVGRVELDRRLGAVVIRYNRLPGIVDTLKPFAGGWLGRMELGRRVVWFSLRSDSLHPVDGQ